MAGGETPILKSHQDAVSRFFHDKAGGDNGRQRFEETYLECKEKAGRLLNVSPEEIAFLSSTSEGVNLLAHALDWESGDNVVVADLEFPSDVLPWTRLERLGVELRLVRHRNWRVFRVRSGIAYRLQDPCGRGQPGELSDRAAAVAQ